MAAYLKATGREAIADAADAVAARPAPRRRGASPTPATYFDQVIEIDLDQLGPLINGPHTPDLAHQVAEVGATAQRRGLAARDLVRADRLVHQQLLRGHHPRRVDRPPGVGQGPARQDAAADHARAPSRSAPPSSATACSPTSRPSAAPCWPTPAARASASGTAPTSTPSKLNTIVNSYNRNFPKRNDGNANTLAFVTTPDTVIAYALAGTLDFDPRTDTLTNDAGEEVRLDPPVGEELPEGGFDPGETTFQAPPADGSGVEVVVDPSSDRLQLLEPFAPWDGKDYVELPVLLKAKGKCTTDHISAAGPWLKYRGHLENISGNLFLGAINAFTGEAGTGKDPLDGETRTFPEIAKHLHEAGVGWVAIGDEN